MNGGSGTLLPLARLAPGEGAFELPDWPGLRVLRLRRAEERRGGRFLYVLLEGELLIDLPGGAYLHLRPGDAAQIEGEHALSPIGEAVVLEWKPSS
ncbi:hypothetical protein [Oceanithermus sp.]|jgi:hypothetical protein